MTPTGPAVAPAPPDRDDWHALDPGDVAARLECGPSGLSADQAADRLSTWGPNEVARTDRTGPLRLFLRQFADVLIWVLLGAAAVSGLVLGDMVDAVVILAIVALNSLIGFSQEARAEAALASLSELSAPEARVVRDGAPVTVPAAEVVPGDLLALAAGDRVAGDARIVESVRLAVDEATLTGESVPVEKGIAAVPADAGIADRRNMVFAGTVVTAGRARAVVVETGRRTQMGLIAEMLSSDEPPTPLQVELGRVGRRIALLAGVVAVVIFGLGLLRGLGVESLFLVAVALAVAAIPEGLPAVTTITLSRGVGAMARRNALIRRLPAVETLGAATVICTDKTGTLTRNRMAVEWVTVGDRSVSLHEDEPDVDLGPHALVCALCSDVSIDGDRVSGEPTEVALVEAVHPRLIDARSARESHPRLDEAAFDSSRKRMSTVHADGDRYLLAVKGAPEVVLERCDRVVVGGRIVELDPERRARLLDRVEEYARGGLRTLATAYRTLDHRPAHPADEEEGLVLAGLAAMRDEIRPEAAEAVALSEQAGIRVVMVTGDHRVTAAAVAGEVGIEGEVMDGRRLQEVDVDELAARVSEFGVYARVDPADKVKIIEAWRRHDAIVAMTGDGVNDAPALKQADIGVAMGSGTDVAKEASDMVLADDNFASIVAAVEEGRGIFGNVKKVVYFLLAANISEILTMLAGFAVFGAYGEPLLAAQLLWINLVTDGLPALALGMDPAPRGVMRRPPETDRNILGVPHQGRLLWQGAILATGPVAVITYGLYARDLPWESVRTLAFTTLVLAQLAFAYAVRAQSQSMLRGGNGRNPVLAWAVAGSIVLQVLVVYTPLGAAWFATVPIAAVDWVAVIAASTLPVLAIDALKAAIRSRHPGRATAFD